MKGRLIQSKFWTDSFIRSLTVIQSHLFLYFINNNHLNILNCYECSNDLISFETKITIDEILIAKKIFEEKNKILFFQDYIYLVNAHKYQKFTGPQNETAKKKILQEMSPAVREWYRSIDRGMDGGIHRGIKKNKESDLSDNNRIPDRGIDTGINGGIDTSYNINNNINLNNNINNKNKLTKNNEKDLIEFNDDIYEENTIKI